MAHAEQFVVDRRLTMRVSRDGGVLVLRLAGDLDLGTAAALDEQLIRAEESDATQIVLDLRGLDFIDSTGLQAVLTAVRRSQRDSNRLGLLRGTGEVARLLELTGIDLSVNVLD